MCWIVIILFYTQKCDDQEKMELCYDLLMVKVYYFQFVLPYNCYFLVIASLLFSVIEFYKSLRNTLFSELTE